MKITYEVQEMGVWFVLLVEMKGGRREQTEQHTVVCEVWVGGVCV